MWRDVEVSRLGCGEPVSVQALFLGSWRCYDDLPGLFGGRNDGAIEGEPRYIKTKYDAK